MIIHLGSTHRVGMMAGHSGQDFSMVASDVARAGGLEPDPGSASPGIPNQTNQEAIHVTTWNDVQSYLHSTFGLVEVLDANSLKIVLPFSDDGRSQIVYVRRVVMATTGEEWINIDSPFAKVAEVDIGAVLARLEGDVCGGLVKVGDFLLLRQASYLSTADAEEVLRPIQLLASAADDLERLLNRDIF